MIGFLLRLLPWWVWALILSGLAAGLGVQTVRLAGAQSALATEQRDRADERRRATERALQATGAARAEEQRRTAALHEVTQDAEKRLSQARADAAAAAGAAGRLRQRAAELAARCDRASSDPPAADGGAPAGGAGLVLADLLGRADDRAGELAEAFDAAREAGIACERAYDSLIGPVGGLQGSIPGAAPHSP